jgi:membrane fusion protein (multidrug efflux system)
MKTVGSQVQGVEVQLNSARGETAMTRQHQTVYEQFFRVRDNSSHVSGLFTAITIVLSTLAGPAALAQEGRPPPIVTVLEVAPQRVIVTAALPGRVVASAIAEVRPQVAGIITERLFEEGSYVEAGDPLYQIDAATYDAGVALAEAVVAQAEAQFSAADKEELRVRELVDRAVATQQNLEEAIAARDIASAAIAVAQARLTAARIEQTQTTIMAPLSGEIGFALTTQGALVTAGQSAPLAIIRNIDTVYIDVTQSASEVLRWRRQSDQSNLTDAERTVSLVLADGGGYGHTGVLRAAEPYVDPQTGVVVLRMLFPNPEKLLLPGMYVRVDVQTHELENVFLISQKAVRRDRRGRPTTLVVGSDGIVEERQLTVAQAQGADWIVTDGLTAGELIVMEGSQNAPPGTSVLTEFVGALPGPAATD